MDLQDQYMISMLRSVVNNHEDVTQKYAILSDVVDSTSFHSAVGSVARNMCYDVIVKNPGTDLLLANKLLMKSYQNAKPKLPDYTGESLQEYLTCLSAGQSHVIARNNSGLAYALQDVGNIPKLIKQ